MRIGLLTSGGDAPGMNACIRAVVRYAIYKDIEVIGYERGYSGIINDTFKPMERRSVSDILHRGGTIIKTARCEEFMTIEGRELAANKLKKEKIDALIVIGGDGSITGANLLFIEHGIKTIGIPATIDNDLAYTDYSIGFDTAVNTVVSAINNLRDTMTSHDRVCIVEVMGRRCGDIALYSGIAGGAEAILIPEKTYSIPDICNNINNNYDRGKTSDIIVLAEGCMSAQQLSVSIKNIIPNLPIRCTVLGYLQRGGSPSFNDRSLAAQFAVRAVDLVLEGQGGRTVGISSNAIMDMEMSKALQMCKQVNEKLYSVAKILCL